MTIEKFVRGHKAWFFKGAGGGRGVYRLRLSCVYSPVRGMTRYGYVQGLSWLCGISVVKLGGDLVKLSYVKR